jgi:phosphatidylserine/phosphatidylglycerophosphate/cardiolipin synthase-like enzyme
VERRLKTRKPSPPVSPSPAAGEGVRGRGWAKKTTMSRRKTFLSVLLPGLIILALVASSLPADHIVKLKDGRELKGTVVEQAPETIGLETERGVTLRIHRGLIASIEGPALETPKLPGEVEEFRFIGSRDYLDAVQKAMKSAKRSIKVMMFFSNYSAHPRNAANILLGELAAAKKRGVEVEIILETSHEEIVNRGNRGSADWLLEEGIEAMFYPTFPVMHVKLVLIDDEISIVGSHNWTNAAIYNNSESSALVRCPRTARTFREYFARAQSRSAPYREIKKREEEKRSG